MCRVILKAKSKCKGSSKPPWYEISAFFIACLLTYSAIASGRKGNLNVCFHDSLFHGWDDVVIGTALWEEILVYIESLKKIIVNAVSQGTKLLRITPAGLWQHDLPS